jgi:hypothetical protein
MRFNYFKVTIKTSLKIVGHISYNFSKSNITMRRFSQKLSSFSLNDVPYLHRIKLEEEMKFQSKLTGQPVLSLFVSLWILLKLKLI